MRIKFHLIMQYVNVYVYSNMYINKFYIYIAIIN